MTSHDGVFRVVARNIEKEILEQSGGIKIEFSGSRISK